MHATLAGLAVVAASASLGGAAVAGDSDAGTAGQPPPRERCSTRVEERNLRLFEERLALMQAGDAEASRSYFSADGVVEIHGSVPYAGTYTVQDGAYGATMAHYFTRQPGAAPPPDPILYADCDRVILIGQVVSQAVATGETLDTTVIEYFTFDVEGKITRDDFYYTDTVAVNDVLTA